MHHMLLNLQRQDEQQVNASQPVSYVAQNQRVTCSSKQTKGLNAALLALGSATKSHSLFSFRAVLAEQRNLCIKDQSYPGWMMNNY